jgi:hypothetical protein
VKERLSVAVQMMLRHAAFSGAFNWNASRTDINPSRHALSNQSSI